MLNVFNDAGRRKLYKLLRQLRDVPVTAKLTLDFSHLSEIKISAILVLYAHLEVLLQSRPQARTFWSKPLDQDIDQKLAELGVWALLGEEYQTVQGAIQICSISYEQKQTDQKQPLRDAVTYAKEAIASYKVVGFKDDSDDGAFAEISESFTYVWQHAYAEDLQRSHCTLGESPVLKKWWIALSHFDNQLFMAVYDIGVGIPYSTRLKPWYTRLHQDIASKFGGKNADCHDIQTALAYGSSRYCEQGRGNGLPAIKNFVETNPNGEFYIMSGKGIYNCHSKGKTEEWSALDIDYPGTLIQWNLALGDGRTNSNEK
ncbi:MAG: hypothetical protein Q7K57_25360 [Burkholderiaceae bacterium]|nr:hypothetical protein [Burkholderiaceae bacterium]